MTVEDVKEQIAIVTHHLVDLKKELDNYEFDEDDDDDDEDDYEFEEDEDVKY
jgi:hypothetical protein